MKGILLAITLSIALVGIAGHAFAQSDEKFVMFETELGNLVIGFFPDDAPLHVENFIKLTESGYYDNTLFHRIIPGFMIQGGDPNTVGGDPGTWGQGGPEERLTAEFNDIKHNRGIVSMARSADPNSAGSQFFIVHHNSNFLDGSYTAFGRIVTEASLVTLDEIVGVPTDENDRPVNPDAVRIIKASVISKQDVSDMLSLSNPERTETPEIPEIPAGPQRYENIINDYSIEVPEGWQVQEPDKITADIPDVIALGPQTSFFPPVISAIAQPTDGQTYSEIVEQKVLVLNNLTSVDTFSIIEHDKTVVNGKRAYQVAATQSYVAGNQTLTVQFREVTIYTQNTTYSLSYANAIENFDEHLDKFSATLNSFALLSEEKPKTTDDDDDDSNGGGCLIATAAYGTEMAPQIQTLREIRDGIVLSTESGKSFMSGFNQIYYSFSPYIADWERENPVFKETVKVFITPMLSTLSILNHVNIDSEQEMITFGAGIILLNIGMYIGMPAIILYKARKLVKVNL